MNLLHEFLKQEVPKSRKEPLPYYLESMKLNDAILSLYFALISILLLTVSAHVFWVPLLALAAMLGKHWLMRKLWSIRLILLMHALILWSWCTWCIITFGWGCGVQHFLLLIILMSFFSVYEPPMFKLAYFLMTMAVRLLLYDYTLYHAPIIAFDELHAFVNQVLNSMAFYFILAGCCVIYSSNLQETMRQLMLHNERLQRQAETDPLTRLYNRRYMLFEMSQSMELNPSMMCCVAIADIDFFKKVNDTYGHNCGDYVLRQLASLLTEMSQGRYTVARWGGEEFCFFFPNMNLDDAGALICDICAAVRKMDLEFEGHRFHITLTAGVEDNDFRSSLDTLIERADRKLYMGKQNGRDQVVV
ncbi:MAG: GGDEF domain-containing protein [Oscillospiraceae bacterium]|nr:GGDEF domain-containing protein [Oscillospiraceae bacterium]